MRMPSASTQSFHLSKGYSAALASSLFLSTTAIFIRHLILVYRLPALVLAFWRDLIVVLTILFILIIIRRDLLQTKRKNLPYFAVYGVVLALFNSFWTFSVELNGAAVATVLIYSSVAFTALLGWFFLREQLGWVKLLAVITCLVGCTLVSGVLNADSWKVSGSGMLCGLLAGLSYAIYSLLGRLASKRGINPWSALLYTFTFATLFLFGANLVGYGKLPGGISQTAELFWLGNQWIGWMVLFLLAAGPTLAGFGLYNVSLSYLPASVVNLILTTEPVFTAFFAYVMFAERFILFQWIGSLMILSGVICLRVYEGCLVNKKQLNHT